jgi:protease I
MAKFLILVDNTFQDAEGLYPYYRLQEAGFQVDVVGPVKGTIYIGKYGYPLQANASPEEIKVDQYAGILIPGGQAPDRMRINDQMVNLVREADAAGLVVAAICHGPSMLIEAGVVRGKNATCFKSVATDLINAGAIYHDRPVVVDNNLITSRTPDDLPDFCREILICLECGNKGGQV